MIFAVLGLGQKQKSGNQLFKKMLDRKRDRSTSRKRQDSSELE